MSSFVRSSYVGKTLSESEEVIANATFCWMRFILPVLGIICGFGIFWLIHEEMNIPFAIIASVIILYSYYKILDYMEDEATLTNQRIVAKRHLFNRKVLDLPLSQVESVYADLPFIRSWLLYTGTLVIRGTGGSQVRIPWIWKVLEFRKLIQDILNESRSQNLISQDKSPIQLIQNNNNSKDKIELLVKLKELLDEGVLSKEEFQVEKERIMNNT